MQFSNWLDALILVFSYHDESSLIPMADIYHAFQEGRGQEVPILIVGTVGKQNGRWQGAPHRLVLFCSRIAKCTQFCLHGGHVMVM